MTGFLGWGSISILGGIAFGGIGGNLEIIRESIDPFVFILENSIEIGHFNVTVGDGIVTAGDGRL